jgi:hypothetical protein
MSFLNMQETEYDETCWVHVILKEPTHYSEAAPGQLQCMKYYRMETKPRSLPLKEFTGIPWTLSSITTVFTGGSRTRLPAMTCDWIDATLSQTVVVDMKTPPEEDCDSIIMPLIFERVVITPLMHEDAILKLLQQ